MGVEFYNPAYPVRSEKYMYKIIVTKNHFHTYTVPCVDDLENISFIRVRISLLLIGTILQNTWQTNKK